LQLFLQDLSSIEEVDDGNREMIGRCRPRLLCSISLFTTLRESYIQIITC